MQLTENQRNTIKQEQHDAFRSDLLYAEVDETDCCYENEGTENPST